MLIIMINAAIIGAILVISPFDYPLEKFYATYYYPPALALIILIPVDVFLTYLFITTMFHRNTEQNVR